MKLEQLMLEDRADSLATNMSEVLTSQYSKETGLDAEPRDVINKLMKLDPTRQSMYINWLAKMYGEGKFQIDDQRLKHELAEFERVKSKLQVQDINQYQTVEDLYRALAPFEHEDVGDSNADSTRERKLAESDVIYKGKDFTIISPRTPDAAKYFGRGTSFRSASKDDDFEAMHKAAPVYYLTDKSGSKIELHFPAHADSEQQGPTATSSKGAKISFKALIQKYPDLLGVLKEKTAFADWADANNPEAALWYAENVMGGRYEEAEPAIAKSATASLKYATNVIKGRFAEGESAIAADSPSAISYCKYVLKERWPAAEANMMKKPHLAVQYAKEVIRGRWPEAEAAIKSHPKDAAEYQKDILKGSEWPDDIDKSRHEGKAAEKKAATKKDE